MKFILKLLFSFYLLPLVSHTFWLVSDWLFHQQQHNIVLQEPSVAPQAVTPFRAGGNWWANIFLRRRISLSSQLRVHIITNIIYIVQCNSILYDIAHVCKWITFNMPFVNILCLFSLHGQTELSVSLLRIFFNRSKIGFKLRNCESDSN